MRVQTWNKNLFHHSYVKCIFYDTWYFKEKDGNGRSFLCCVGEILFSKIILSIFLGKKSSFVLNISWFYSEYILNSQKIELYEMYVIPYHQKEIDTNGNISMLFAVIFVQFFQFLFPHFFLNWHSLLFCSFRFGEVYFSGCWILLLLDFY